VPVEKWELVNDVTRGQEKAEVVIFEGWCVGFRSRPEQEVRMLWEDATRRRKDEGGIYEGRLGYVALEDVKVVNEALKEYDIFTESVSLSYPSNFPFYFCLPYLLHTYILLTGKLTHNSQLDALIHLCVSICHGPPLSIRHPKNS